MRINHNIAALNTYRQLTGNVNNTSKSLEKLSAGLRINKAGDDAAGLAISEKMRAQIRGLDQASRNASDAISLIQTAEGALTETHSILQRMRELAVQASTDTNTESDRAEIQKEINNLLEEIDRIGDQTQFNGQELLDGSYTGTFHIGANQGQNMTSNVGDMRAAALEVAELKVELEGAGGATGTNASTTDFAAGATQATGVSIAEGSDYDGAYTVTVTGDASTGFAFELSLGGSQVGSTVNVASGDVASTSEVTVGDVTISFTAGSISDGSITFNASPAVAGGSATPTGGVLTRDDANDAIGKIDSAIQKVSSERAKLGGIQNRLEHTINNLGATSENLSASESRIRDVDMAKEMMEFTKNNILSQASQAMLAQANMQPQSVLQLLQ